MADADPEVSFAAVYDVVHESAPDFLRAQLAFLQDLLPAYPGSPSELRSEARMIFLASG